MDQARFDWIIKAIDFDQLNDWEEKFIDSCDAMMRGRGDLTPKMEEVLERIFEERQ